MQHDEQRSEAASTRLYVCVCDSETGVTVGELHNENSSCSHDGLPVFYFSAVSLSKVI